MQEGDLIQITNEKHHWYPCILIVSEVRSWGCMAYCIGPLANDKPGSTGNYFIRLKHEDFESITENRAILMMGYDEEE